MRIAADPPGTVEEETVPRRLRRPWGTRTFLLLFAVVLLPLVMFVALRDIADRVGTGPATASGDGPSFGSAGLGSAFSPGPRLGDLRDLFTAGAQDMEGEPLREGELPALLAPTPPPSPAVAEAPAGPRAPRRPRGARTDNSLCDLPALC